VAEPEVIIIIDALGYDVAMRHGFNPPGLGAQARVRTVLGFSQAALTTMLTGLNPSGHGLWMMYSFGEKRLPFAWLRNLPARASCERRWVRRLINWKLERVDGMRAYYNLYDVPRDVLCHLDIPARKGLFSRGSVEGRRTVIDEAFECDGPVFIRDYHTGEEKAFDELEAALSAGSAGWHMLYTAGLDSTMHEYGTGHEETSRRLAWYGERISALLAANPRVRLTVLGDHGMADVKGFVDVPRAVGSLGLKMPSQYIPFYDSTMARFRIMDRSCESKLRDALNGAGGGRVIEAGEMKRLGIFFEDGRFGDLIYLMEEGNIILPSFMGRNPVAAMHGYHPEGSSMFSALFANYELPGDRFELIDVAGLIGPRRKTAGGRP